MTDPHNRRGVMLVFCAPSGAGKTTITRQLLENDDKISLSVSATTREARPGEEEGKHYFFKSVDDFKHMIADDELLEWAEVFGNYYGTPLGPVDKALSEGRDVLFDIDWQGARQLRDKGGDDVVSVFILPPSSGELERRLRDRGQDADDVIMKRMAKAGAEISHWEEFDYVLINDDLDRCIADVRHIIGAERIKRERQTGLPGFVKKLLTD
ncbi:guanylate kinase [Thalassospira sp. HJ]|uniref:guanylate kinase n=1 Tax=unclassified Thalassospira TaxID=2648997 RepID=UPI0005CE397F|nr:MULTISPECIES: guanylate kinase [unclassified Thalassospira]KJE36417.1 guanylate kinase [Thalassospira sp. HJ]MBC08227.1 guanylate kinase [Thalassospira sp.]|tara:strand:- start:2521 stop:3153 length:633 start_codon:yes stop_codon:yes gene_type:complete